MKRTLALALILFGLMSCSLFDENTPKPDPQNSAPTVTLSASTLSGAAPLAVTFTATASDPDGDTLSYTWSLDGAADAPTVNQTFTEAGSYPISVTVSDGELEASASVNVTVTEAGTDPNPDPDPNPNPDPDPEPNITLSVTASPGGPVPWGVTYEIEASGEVPDSSTLSVTCAGQSAVNLTTLDVGIQNVFSCIHLTTGDKVVSTLKDKSDKVLAQKEQIADVRVSESIPFGGAWEYSGVTGDQFSESSNFDITQAVNASTGRGGGEYTGELAEPLPNGTLQGEFTLSAKGNRLILDSDIPFDGDPLLDRTLVFIGAYEAETPSGISAPDGKRQQVFYAPNTQKFDSNDGYLYTVQ